MTTTPPSPPSSPSDLSPTSDHDDVRRVQCGPFLVQCVYSVGGDGGSVIERVRLPLTPEQWVDVLNGDGEHLPSCCGSIDSARSIFVRALHDDRWVDADDFRDLCEILIDHGFEDFKRDGHLSFTFHELQTSPFPVLTWMWITLRELLAPPTMKNESLAPTSVEDCALVVEKVARAWVRGRPSSNG
jgi:hypothetical protein